MLLLLRLLLQNLHDAPWPKEFDAKAYSAGMEGMDEDNAPKTFRENLRRINPEIIRLIAEDVLADNEFMRPTPFFECYILPIQLAL